MKTKMITTYNRVGLITDLFTIDGISFAYDGCHKIYIIQNESELKIAKSYGYRIYDLDELEEKYNHSCSLKFIVSWDLSQSYIGQFEAYTISVDEF